MESRPSYRRVLSSPGLLALWGSQVISQSGDFVFLIALFWLVLSATGSTFLVGLTQAIVWVPLVLVNPISGVYVDRLNRKTMILLSNLAQGIILAVLSELYVLHWLTPVLIMIFVLLLFSAAQFLTPAINAMIPRLVSEKSDLAPANGLFSLSSSLNKLASYALGGLIVAALGVAVPILYDSITFFVAAGMVFFFVAQTYGEPNRGVTSQLAPSFVREFMGGLAYVKSNRFVLELAALGVVLNFCLSGIVALVAPYASIWLHGNSITYGLIAGAFGFGAFVGSSIFGKLKTQNYGRFFLFASLLVGTFASSMGAVSISLVSLVLAFGLGCSNTLAALCIQVIIQANVPGELLGRVFTILVAILNIAAPASAVLAGQIAETIPIGTIFVALGLIIIVATFLSHLVFKDLRTEI